MYAYLDYTSDAEKQTYCEDHAETLPVVKEESKEAEKHEIHESRCEDNVSITQVTICSQICVDICCPYEGLVS